VSNSRHDSLPTRRTRLCVALVSCSVIGLELALMRGLSVRFWHHFAQMIIGVALLGFGASGTAIALGRRGLLKSRRTWIAASTLLYALSIPVAQWAGRFIPLNIPYLAWDWGQLCWIGAMQLGMFVPFLLAGCVIGLVLTDRPQKLAGHYAANLLGSGAGALWGVLAMYAFTAQQLPTVMAAVALIGGLTVLRPKPKAVAVGLGTVVALITLGWSQPHDSLISQYKALSYLRRMPETETIYRNQGPLGRIDVVAGPAIHFSPGLSVQFTGEVPPHAVLILDGDRSSGIYDGSAREDWRFADYTTSAAAYHLGDRENVLVVGTAGGCQLGLAWYHRARRILGLEMDGQVIEAMRGPLARRGGRIYEAEGVQVVQAGARGYLAATPQRFDLIQLASVGGSSAGGAGMYAARESYLLTVEAMGETLEHLRPGGLVSFTAWAQTPPRAGLRLFDTAAQALRRSGRSPENHLAMIRSWSSLTLLVSAQPFSAEACESLRQFAAARSFDLCYLPGLTCDEVNRFHILDRPYYFEGCRALLGPRREEYLANYLFRIAATTDDKPYFHHFFRWRSLPVLREQLKGRSRAFLEVGYLMLLAAFVQSVVLAVVFILLPLLPRAAGLKAAAGKAVTLTYFLMLGAGFMLLEMGFLQKLILYLADPLYSTASVIAGFLIFAGVGSHLSGVWPVRPQRLAPIAAAGVVLLATVYLLAMDGWFAATAGAAMSVRFAVGLGTIAPLAFAMGQMFPTGLRMIASRSPTLVPWAWAVNGFASVGATLGAPLLAMQIGFTRLVAIAVFCYALAGWLGRRLARANGAAATDSGEEAG